MSTEHGMLIDTNLIFSDQSRFNMWDHDDRIRLRCYVGENLLPERVIERLNARIHGIIVWHGQRVI